MAEWCTIESDPGVFTELIKNIGVKGVQVDEIIDLDVLEGDSEPVYGLIFLFKYMQNSGYKPNVLTTWDPELFFAKQEVQNACATQAILGILLNNEDKLDIGQTLKELKSFTMEMDPTLRGLAISNSEKIKIEHNKFSHPEPFIFTKTKAEDGDDVFHFVSYIHFKNSIYEIDGLRSGPILIEENVKNEEWIKKVKPSIINRINLYEKNEIKFNLLALVPDRLEKAKKIDADLKKRRDYIQNLIEKKGEVSNDKELEEYNKMTKEQLENSLKDFNSMIKNNEVTIKDEEFKVKKYREENERRQFNYIGFIYELMKTLAEKGKLKQMYKEACDEVEEKQKEKEKQKENEKK
jgi:ubiquitin carboxyl-terminal hydrolase L5